MDINLSYFICSVIFTPLFGAVIAGILGKIIGRTASHRITILFMMISFASALVLFKAMLLDGHKPITLLLYRWGVSGTFSFNVGFMVDSLAAMMMVVVTFVSLLVHIYSIGYMSDDSGYQRFFSYMSLFTFAMLCLVAAHDFVVLFFGWEGVGLVSYLLIGFWFHKETAVFGSLKAFIVNRVGDLGFILGIAAVLTYFGTLDYAPVFHHAERISHVTMSLWPGVHCSVVTVICVLLFIGAAGKSAQMPLHVWLPESMEGPTPISALIHAATMVTAGVYMVCRMSPLFAYSVPAQSVIIVLGGLTALLMGLLGVFQDDLKRVIAYSTLSQLGYMMVGVGASAYAAGMFHLFTHACFKALLFLAAGSVIIAMHHEQDMRKMGGLRKHMPITWLCFLVGGLALVAIPPFAGFYSKDSIIVAARLSMIPGAHLAYWCVLLGAFVTGLYTFRSFFMTFHGEKRFTIPEHKVKESPWVVTLPMVLLAIPSVILGFVAIKPLLYSDPSAYGHALTVLAPQNVLAKMAPEFHGALAMAMHSVVTLPFWFAITGIVVAWIFVIAKPELGARLAPRFHWFCKVMDCKFGFDDFNQIVLVRGMQKIGRFFYHFGDLTLIDSWVVNGSGKVIAWCSSWMRRLQSGYVFHYTFAMLLGVFGLFLWILVGG